MIGVAAVVMTRALQVLVAKRVIAVELTADKDVVATRAFNPEGADAPTLFTPDKTMNASKRTVTDVSNPI
jgi:hypothetical protein